MARAAFRLSRCVLQRFRGGSGASALHICEGASTTRQIGSQPFTQLFRMQTAQLSPFASAQQTALYGGSRHHKQVPPTTHSRRHMFIQTQATPNPSSLMFLPGIQVMDQGSKEFSSMREAMVSPLATALFRIEGVAGVFFGSDFVTVKKSEDIDWDVLKPEIYAAIMDHFSSTKPLFNDTESDEGGSAIREDDTEVVQMIKELLETRIRPAVAEDGGDVLFLSFEEDIGRVTLKMQGACSGCPSSAVTLKNGIEQMMKHYIPEVKEVVEAPADDVELASQQQLEKLEKHLSP